MTTPKEQYLNGYEQGYIDAINDTEEWYPKQITGGFGEKYLEIAEDIRIYPQDQVDTVHRGTLLPVKMNHEYGWFFVWVPPTLKNKILNQLAQLKDLQSCKETKKQ